MKSNSNVTYSNNTYSVYCHINKINYKRYIGITSKSPEKRWGINGSGYLRVTYGKYHQPVFAKAILKYDWDNFEHKIIAENLSEYEAKELEKDLIKKYHSNNPQFGYNITIGGESNLRYLTEEEQQQAKLRSKTKAWQKQKEKLSNEEYHLTYLEHRRDWYKTKIKDQNFKTYLKEKSKVSYIRHKQNLTEEELILEKAKHTKYMQDARKIKQQKLNEIKLFIKENRNRLSSIEAITFINSIKWYKVYLLKAALIIEQNILQLIQN